MSTYRIRLHETRLTTEDIDDVALFDVTREEDGQTWRVPVYMSPLFRVLHVESRVSDESRREMVAGLGARAVAERLRRGAEPPFERALVLAIDYPGAPGDPEPLPEYEHVTVRADDAGPQPVAP